MLSLLLGGGVIERGTIGTLVIAHKDRLARFGFYGLRRYEKTLKQEFTGGGR